MDTGEIGIIAEYYVICELIRNGYKPFKAINPTQYGWDIKLDSLNAKLQVKGIEWDSKINTKTNPTITIKNLDFDFLIIVIINYNATKYTTLIIPKDKLKLKGSHDRYKLIDEDGYIYHSEKNISLTTLDKDKNKKIFELYEDKWDSLKTIEK